MPIGVLHHELLDALFAMFDLTPPDVPDAFHVERHVHDYVRQRSRRVPRADLARCYRAALLLAFDAAGVQRALAAFAAAAPPPSPGGRLAQRKATQLLGELLAAAGELLPTEQCVRMNTLAPLLAAAGDVALARSPQLDGSHPRAASLVYSLSSHSQLPLHFADYAGLEHPELALYDAASSRSRGGANRHASHQASAAAAAAVAAVEAASLATSPLWQPRSPRNTVAMLQPSSLAADELDPALAAHAYARGALREALALTRDQMWRGPRPTTRKLARVVELKRRMDASLDEAAFRQRVEVS